MARGLAPRLKKSDYVGRHAYLFTICTYQRLPLLSSTDLVESLLKQFRQCAEAHDVANHAYSFMPDHVHFVAEGRSRESAACELVRVWKSQTAFHFKQATKCRLWQRGYYDRVLRDVDEMAAFTLYVIDNPIRAGLPATRCATPFVGSDTMTVEEIRCRKLAGYR
jgi:putative transposase